MMQSISFKWIMTRNCFLSKCFWKIKCNKYADVMILGADVSNGVHSKLGGEVFASVIKSL